jgi:hypothetical protein
MGKFRAMDQARKSAPERAFLDGDTYIVTVVKEIATVAFYCG